MEKLNVKSATRCGSTAMTGSVAGGANGAATMNPLEIAKILDSNTLRIEKIILLAGATDGMSMTQDLEDFIDDHTLEDVCEIIPGIPDWCKEQDDDFILEALGEAMKYGYIVQCATPVKKYIKAVKNCASFSWGSYYTKWFYAENIDDVIALAVVWSQEMAEKDKAKIAA